MPPSIAARRLAAASFVVALVAADALAFPAVALAHAEVVESNPAANSALIEAPASLTITFSEPIDPAVARIDLLDAEQRAVEGLGTLNVSSDGRTAEMQLPDIDPGVYTVSYQVVSTVDGHATAGFYAFLIDPSGAAPPPTDTATESSPSVDPFSVAARWVALVAMLVALGSVLTWWNARGVVAPTAPPHGLIAVSAALAAAGVACYLLLAARPIQGDGTGVPFDVAGAFGWTPFAIAMRVAIVASLAAAGATVIARLRRSTSAVPALVAGVALAMAMAGMSLAGHAASGGVAFAALDWVHLVAVAAWLGGLPAAFVMGARAARTGGATTSAVLRRHGRLALVAGPLVALTGIANSPVVLGSPRDLVASDYGNLLLAKAGLLSVALGIGAVNHLALRGRGRASVAALVGAELVVAALAVSAAATMVTIQPAAARQPELTVTPATPAHFFATIGRVRAHLSVSLPTPGEQVYRALLADAATGAPRDDVQKVFVELVPPAGSGLTPERVELTSEPDPLGGLYGARGTFTPLEGDWSIDLIVRRAGELDESASFVMPVASAPAPEAGPPPDTGIGVPAPLAAAWSLLPPGAAGWLPALLALSAVAFLGRLPRSSLVSAARGAAVAVAIVGIGATGTRELVASANEPASKALAEQAVDSGGGDAQLGEALYRANCASCHGIDADGHGAVPTLPDAGPLREAVAEQSDAELSYRIAYGVAGTPMPPFAGLLTAEDRANLIAYLRRDTRDD